MRKSRRNYLQSLDSSGENLFVIYFIKMFLNCNWIAFLSGNLHNCLLWDMLLTCWFAVGWAENEFSNEVCYHKLQIHQFCNEQESVMKFVDVCWASFSAGNYFKVQSKSLASEYRAERKQSKLNDKTSPTPWASTINMMREEINRPSKLNESVSWNSLFFHEPSSSLYPKPIHYLTAKHHLEAI